ncbi:hypothetical protein ILUMI_23076 [Ignelater luminosus]|uniref:Peroxidase n=1 Tax=Ignelater luminosus TaxID=2038154 RepID=A0A8K0C9G4_IGNLU|nr:hypothetical protein ILUMI_23076 [Ignelater luminosus]
MCRLITALFSILVIHNVYSYECSVCVTQPLITSPVKCPICTQCDVNKYNDSTKDYGLEKPDEQEPNSNCSQKDWFQSYNWSTCFVDVKNCDDSKYRRHDGSCNNLKHPTWGMKGTAFTRILEAHYSDDKRSFRLGSNKQPLPLPRVLSVNFFPDINNADKVTLATMEWGQLVTHDMGLSVPLDIPFIPNDCCQPNLQNRGNICLSLIIPTDDYFYSKYNITCLTRNVRTKVTSVGCCKGIPIEQVNAVTHNIDASLVYGSDTQAANAIREFKNGKLKIQKTRDKRVFPPTLSPNETIHQCSVKDPKEICYQAGDPRINQNTQITLLQIMILREHNRLAEKLQILHPLWNDEKVYQETRAIVIAQIQHITYSKWLVHYIGRENMRKFELFSKAYGYTRYYDDINFMTINSFTTGAFRIGHSGIQGNLSCLNYRLKQVKQIPIGHWMNRPLIIQKDNNYDELLLGLVNQPMQVFENYVTDQMTNLMFSALEPFGDDLVGLDINRGRDHGLAPYIYYLEVCTGYQVKTFEDLKKYISEKFIEKLSLYYYSVKDIDLYVGGTFEKQVPGTRLGPTFLCIITEQFYRKKWGDRFWYEVGGQPNSFTIDQLQEIRKSSLSRIICDNSDNISSIQRDSFLPPSESNKIVNCKDLPTIDLNKWK